MPRVLIEDFGLQIVDVGYGMWDQGEVQGARLKERDQRTDYRGQITTYNV